MLSFGTAAFIDGKGMVATNTSNLETLPGATMDPITKSEFWDKNPEAWAACRKDLQPVEATMKAFVAWVDKVADQYKGRPVFVGYPATFDFLFMYFYMVKFAGRSPFSFSALDIKSYVAGFQGMDFRDSTKRNMPREWFPRSKHTHIALDDAIEQGELFMNIRRARLARTIR